MSLASGSTGKRSRHRWRGVVEDFVDLNLKEHSYQCILKHTDNLMKKLQRKQCADAMVQKGVIPSLVAILGQSDLHPGTLLQQTALSVLATICKMSKDTVVFHRLVQAKAMPHLLKLLKLHSDDLALNIIYIINGIMNLEMGNVIQSQREYIEALVAGTKCTDPVVKQDCLRLLADAVIDDMPSAEEIRQCVSQLNILLRDASPNVVNLTIDVYTNIAFGGSDDVIKAMISTGCLPQMTQILDKENDPLFSDTTTKVDYFFKVLEDKGDWLENEQLD